VTIHVAAGNGGHGCASVHREKFKPLGGPDGGNGGNGGSVRLVVDPQVHTLLDFHFRPHAKAGNGKPGAGDNRDGAMGEDLVLNVPDGTVVLDENGTILADLVGTGTTFEAAQGGRGGLGNASLASKARKAPGFALLGEEGQQRSLVLELKSVADVGLVGFPSAGKSSLVSVLSAAKPKIADYPFTTLTPNLGVVAVDGREFVLADIPGLIEGAHEGVGIGDKFLGHVERCQVLLHLVDATSEDPLRDHATVRSELVAYGAGLADKPEIVALSKCDAVDAKKLDKMRKALSKQAGVPVMAVSSAANDGVTEVLRALAGTIDDARATQAETAGEEPWRP
jgi:GTP-binding protein